MHIDYSTYSFKDLIDVKERIDAERFPQNYKDLLAEIELRRSSDNLNSTKHRDLIPEMSDDDDVDKDFILEFSPVGQTKRRYAFIAFFILANIILISIIVSKHMVKSLASVHQYNTTLSALKCHKVMIVDEEDDEITTYYDLEIISGEDKFTAFDVGKSMCQLLMRDYKFGNDISVWHDQGIAYQLKSQSRMLLSYRFLKPNIRRVQQQDIFSYWFGLIALWFLFFKSFINAIFPETFTNDDVKN